MHARGGRGFHCDHSRSLPLCRRSGSTPQTAGSIDEEQSAGLRVLAMRKPLDRGSPLIDPIASKHEDPHDLPSRRLSQPALKLRDDHVFDPSGDFIIGVRRQRNASALRGRPTGVDVEIAR